MPTSHETPQQRIDRLNLVPAVVAMGWLWGAPMFGFWATAFGPLKPFHYPQVDTAPSLTWLAIAVAACFIPLLFGPLYFKVSRRGFALSLYKQLGVRTFRRFATSGDYILARIRRQAPSYRVISNQAELNEYMRRSIAGERAHLILFLLGMLSVFYAIYLGWFGWAVLLTIGNLIANFYPCLLQRYNRARISAVSSRFRV